MKTTHVVSNDVTAMGWRRMATIQGMMIAILAVVAVTTLVPMAAFASTTTTTTTTSTRGEDNYRYKHAVEHGFSEWGVSAPPSKVQGTGTTSSSKKAAHANTGLHRSLLLVFNDSGGEDALLPVTTEVVFEQIREYVAVKGKQWL
jgi:hypothetical protein